MRAPTSPQPAFKKAGRRAFATCTKAASAAGHQTALEPCLLQFFLVFSAALPNVLNLKRVKSDVNLGTTNPFPSSLSCDFDSASYRTFRTPSREAMGKFISVCSTGIPGTATWRREPKSRPLWQTSMRSFSECRLRDEGR